MSPASKTMLAGLISGVCLLLGLQALDWWTLDIPPARDASMAYSLHGFKLCKLGTCAEMNAVGSLNVFAPATLWVGSALGVLAILVAFAPTFRLSLPDILVQALAKVGLIVAASIGWCIAMLPPFGVDGWFALIPGHRMVGGFVALAGALAAVATAYLRGQEDDPVTAHMQAPVAAPAVERFRRPSVPPATSIPVATNAPLPARRVARHVEPIDIDFGPPADEASGPDDPFSPPRQQPRSEPKS